MKNMSDEQPSSQVHLHHHHSSQPRIYKNKSATGKDISAESSSSLPEGVQPLLYTLPVNARCVGDGDGFTAYVDMADVPQQVHEALRAWLAKGRRRRRNNQTKVVNGPNNQKIRARKYRIRMRGIDAPELQMEYGMEAKNELVNLIAGKHVKIYVYGMDQYGRYIGDIYCGDMFIQEQMLKRGFAWHFKNYDKRCEFGQWEGEARHARRGIWLSDNPKKPWEWRKEQRNAEKQDVIQMDNGSCEALPRMIKEKKNSKAEATEWKKKWESAVAENQMLNDRLRESKEALSRMIKENKNSEAKATEWKKKWESAVAENQMLNDRLIQESKEVLWNEEKACKQRVKRMAIWVGTSMLTVGIAVLCNKWKTPPKKNGGTLRSHYTRTRI